MVFHRLNVPTYTGGLPVGYDLINDPTHVSVGGAGVAAFADGIKSGGPNDGSYFVAFGEDATSSFANRGLKALAENTDLLDDLLHRDIAVTARTADVVAGGAVSSVVISGDVFVGESGSPNNADQRARLVSALDANDNEIIDSNGDTVVVSLIHDGSSNNVVGTAASGFYSSPTVNFSPPIPSGTTYRLYYGQRSNLATLPQSALTEIKIRAAQEVDGVVERQLRNLHAVGGIQAWDAAWDSTIRALASAGLNERYRRQTTVASVFNYNTPGDGAVIVRDGVAVTALASDITLNTDAYPDPSLALYRAAHIGGISAGGAWPNTAKGGDIGWLHETDANPSNNSNEFSRAGLSGPGFLDVVPRDIRGATLDTESLFFINGQSNASLNPDSDTTEAARATVQCASGQYFRIPTGPDAGKTSIRVGLDLLEVSFVGGSPKTAVYVITEILSATRVRVEHMTGRPALFSLTAVTNARLRVLQPIVSLGGSAGRGGANKYGIMVSAPLPHTQVGGDPGSRFRPPLYLSATNSFSEPFNPATDVDPVALFWGHVTQAGVITNTGELRGDGQIRTSRGAWDLSVGDGVLTFGDFNGATAIRAAIDYLNTTYTGPSGGWNATIHVKDGAYAVSDLSTQIVVPADCVLKLIGNGSRSEGITSQITNSGANTATLVVNGHLTVEGIRLDGSPAGINPYIAVTNVVTGANATLRLKNVVALSLNVTCNDVYSSRDAAIIFDDCHLVARNVRPMVEISMSTTAARTEPIKFINCHIIGAQDMPIVEFWQNGVVSPILSEVTFNGCNITLGIASTVLAHDSVNPGLFRIRSVGTSSATLTLDKLNILNSRIVAPAPSNSGESGIWLYMATDEARANNRPLIKKIKIDNCEFERLTSATINHTYSPFYIGPSNFTVNTDIDTSGFIDVSISNTEFRYIGGSTDRMSHGSQQAGLTNVPNVGVWGCVTIHTRCITLRDIKMMDFAARSVSGDLLVAADHKGYVCNVLVDHYAGPSGNASDGYPSSRVLLYAPSNNGNAVSRALLVEGLSVNSIGQLTIDPGAPVVVRRDAPGVSNGQQRVIIVNSTIDCFGNTVGSGGIWLEQQQPLDIRGCFISGAAGAGVVYELNASPPAISVTDCTIRGCAEEGIRVNPTAAWGSAKCIIANNTIVGNVGRGVFIEATSWGSYGPEIVDNHFSGNATAGGDVDIEIGDDGVDNTTAVILGNDCGGSARNVVVRTQTTYRVIGFSVDGEAADSEITKVSKATGTMSFNRATLATS